MLGSPRFGSHARLALLFAAVLFVAVGCSALPRSMSFGIVVEEARDPLDLSSLALLDLPPPGPPPAPASAPSRPEAPPPPSKIGTGSAEGSTTEIREIPGKHEPPAVLAGEPAPRPLPADRTISPLAPVVEQETLAEEIARETPDRVTLLRIAGLRITLPYSWLADPYSPDAADFPSPYEFR